MIRTINFYEDDYVEKTLFGEEIPKDYTVMNYSKKTIGKKIIPCKTRHYLTKDIFELRQPQPNNCKLFYNSPKKYTSNKRSNKNTYKKFITSKKIRTEIRDKIRKLYISCDNSKQDSLKIVFDTPIYSRKNR